MKAILEFSLPGDLYAFKCASMAQDMAHAIIEIERLYKQHVSRNTDLEDTLHLMYEQVRPLSHKLEN